MQHRDCPLYKGRLLKPAPVYLTRSPVLLQTTLFSCPPLNLAVNTFPGRAAPSHEEVRLGLLIFGTSVLIFLRHMISYNYIYA